MSRLQLALNVADVDEAVDFYTKLFDTKPHKRRPGYANFAIADPPLKLILFETDASPGSINHLGVEVETTDEVGGAIARIEAAGMDNEVQEQTECCFAVQDKVWVTGPDTSRWEIYAITDDDPDGLGLEAPDQGDGVACSC